MIAHVNTLYLIVLYLNQYNNHIQTTNGFVLEFTWRSAHLVSAAFRGDWEYQLLVIILLLLSCLGYFCIEFLENQELALYNQYHLLHVYTYTVYVHMLGTTCTQSEFNWFMSVCLAVSSVYDRGIAYVTRMLYFNMNRKMNRTTSQEVTFKKRRQYGTFEIL